MRTARDGSCMGFDCASDYRKRLVKDDALAEMQGVAWLNPMLKLPQVAKMSGKSLSWVQEQMRCRDHFPYYRPGGPRSQPVVLWSEYVDWFKRKFGEDGER